METNNKLREAVVLALSLLDLEEGVPSKTVSQKDIDFMKAALVEPVKNCEVGTVEQQAKRFEEYCESEVCKRKRCKSRAKALCIEHCALEWAQKPYKVGGEK